MMCQENKLIDFEGFMSYQKELVSKALGLDANFVIVKHRLPGTIMLYNPPKPKQKIKKWGGRGYKRKRRASK